MPYLTDLFPCRYTFAEAQALICADLKAEQMFWHHKVVLCPAAPGRANLGVVVNVCYQHTPGDPRDEIAPRVVAEVMTSPGHLNRFVEVDQLLTPTGQKITVEHPDRNAS